MNMDFVKEYQTMLSLEECKLLINYFENNESMPIELKRDDTIIKKNREINISIKQNGKELDQILFNSIQNVLNKYTNEVSQLRNYEFKDTGYIIQRYNNDMTEKTEKHIDPSDVKLTIVIFLNNIQIGGELEFNNFKIKPEVGKAVIFPSSWMYPYADKAPVSNPRYNIITFVK